MATNHTLMLRAIQPTDRPAVDKDGRPVSKLPTRPFPGRRGRVRHFATPLDALAFHVHRRTHRRMG